MLDEKGVPCGPVNDTLQALADPQTQARDMLVETEHPSLGKVKALGLPVKFSATPGAVCGPAPRLGEHTRAVLAELGYGEEEIAALEREGAVAGLSAGHAKG